MTLALPEEDRSYLSKGYMEDQIVALLGGRTAEELCLGDISTGASNDIQRATQIARKMVASYGMSERIGTVCFDSGHEEVFIGRTMARAAAIPRRWPRRSTRRSSGSWEKPVHAAAACWKATGPAGRRGPIPPAA